MQICFWALSVAESRVRHTLDEGTTWTSACSRECIVLWCYPRKHNSQRSPHSHTQREIFTLPFARWCMPIMWAVYRFRIKCICGHNGPFYIGTLFIWIQKNCLWLPSPVPIGLKAGKQKNSKQCNINNINPCNLQHSSYRPPGCTKDTNSPTIPTKLKVFM